MLPPSGMDGETETETETETEIKREIKRKMETTATADMRGHRRQR